jgi:NADH:ubiquinone reductase (H+-translocating)
VVGGGFGGLEAVKALRHLAVDITLIDRENFHLFQPLTYQVATGALSPDEIAEPLRTIFRHDRNVRVLLGEVTQLDLERRIVVMRPGVDQFDAQTVPYDTLVVATGSTYSYFGHDEWRSHALEVKSLHSALVVRARILRAFEAAELASHDGRSRAAWLTFVVVGAGPTGVEMAGQIAELARDALPDEFRATDTREGRILLVETSDRVLPTFPPKLSGKGAAALRELGVTPMTGHTVVGIDPDGVDIKNTKGTTERVRTRTVVWAAGVTASSLAGALGAASAAEIDRSGRVTVEPDLTLPAHPEVLALGDMVRVRDRRTGTVDELPGLAPVAMQQGRYAGRLLSDRLAGRATPPFRYFDKGNLATIGRARAVADLRGVRVAGLVAWIIWLVVHIAYLIGFANRVVVLVRWAYSFLTRNRAARLIT